MNEAMDRTANRIVNFTAKLKYEDLPKAAVQAAKVRILDSLGVAMAAFFADPVRISRRMVQPAADGRVARLFGTLTPTAPERATFVNGTMVRYLDMNDSYVRAGVSHPSDTIAGLLATAEAEGASGRDLITAVAVAYEIQCRLADVIANEEHGWDQPFIIVQGTAMGAAKLLKLTKRKLHQALSLAIVPNIALNQTRTGTLSMWKGLSGANAARQGVFAAYLAAEGMTGAEDPLEGAMGAWNQLMDGEQFDVPIPSSLAKHKFAIQQSDLKAFPIRYGCHVPVFTALELRKKIDDVLDIQSLKIDTYTQAFGRWMGVPGFWKPETRESADHSLPFCVAAALLDGDITTETFAKKRYLDRDIISMMSKITIELNENFTAAAPEEKNCRMTAALSFNRQASAEIKHTKAHSERAVPKKTVEAKFNKMSAGILSPDNQKKLVDAVWRLDRMDNVAQLVSLTGV
jgi:2-methylcitrate dehydratase